MVVMTTSQDTNDDAGVAARDQVPAAHYGAPSNAPMSSAGSPTGYDPLGGYVAKMTSLLPGAFGNPASAAGALGDYDPRAAHAVLRDLIGREPGFVERQRADGILPSIMEPTGPLGKYGRAVVSGETISTPLPPTLAAAGMAAMPALIEVGEQGRLTPIIDHLGAAVPQSRPTIQLPAGVSVNDGAVQVGSVAIPLPQRAEQLVDTAGKYGIRLQNGQPHATQPLLSGAPSSGPVPTGPPRAAAGKQSQSLAQAMDARYSTSGKSIGKTAVDQFGKPVKRNATGAVIAVIIVIMVFAVFIISATLSRGTSSSSGSVGPDDGGAAVSSTVDWSTYPGFAAELGDYILKYPPAEVQISASENVVEGLKAAVTSRSGLDWDSYGSTAVTKYGDNAYGGESLLQEYRGAQWFTPGMIEDQTVKMQTALDLVDYLHGNGYEYVYLRTEQSGDSIELTDAASALATLAVPANSGLWELSAYSDDAVNSAVRVRFSDPNNDPGKQISNGDRDAAKTGGYPVSSIMIQSKVYDALATVDRPLYQERLAAFDGLTPPQG